MVISLVNYFLKEVKKMPSKLPSYLVRAKQEIFDKMKIIADSNERSLNQEIVYLMKRHIEEYEKTHKELQSLSSPEEIRKQA